ncbi:hypothetical protein NQ317_016291 [Molorchus minor]|uniref:Tyr recombinase domain-containing protein n=1 Tax=Molorchus minor TaxID=1323400 RepID=A0ABQ9IYH6_9CUCU|nr:hypothetical protein NQ317_016291 [Molorchus minor]
MYESFYSRRPFRRACTMNNCESEEIVEAANIAISNLLPTKSRSLYDIAYNRFKKWCAEKNVQVYSENVLLAYFSENAKNYKSSTLWAQYSMVGLILGISGACRTDELVNLTVDDIEDVGSSLIVKIPNTKTKIPRIFVVTDVGNMLELFRKYLSLRPPHVKHKRLFLYYKAGKI